MNKKNHDEKQGIYLANNLFNFFNEILCLYYAYKKDYIVYLSV